MAKRCGNWREFLAQAGVPHPFLCLQLQSGHSLSGQPMVCCNGSRPAWPTNRWRPAKAMAASRSVAAVTAGTATPEKGDQLPPGRCNTTPSVPQAHTRRSRGERSHARVVWRAGPGSRHSNPRGRTSDTNAGEPTTSPPPGTPRSRWAYAAEPVGPSRHVRRSYSLLVSWVRRWQRQDEPCG